MSAYVKASRVPINRFITFSSTLLTVSVGDCAMIRMCRMFCARTRTFLRISAVHAGLHDPVDCG
ncbi:hypothetical protein DAEQUDRAFT_393776 [Daedalea quercina L-15889]|uniref:Uncharacterized protein n=1 Tax=Daedalea quercina L-15889 TaxID=1314783 RepID=A0A165NWS7_9APHY|nr:hypothetical protein DAEQUDRAFT_393776 [Daedalea quercina L-15889]